ncbi:hypothetical protein V1264_000692 [Littorina saxatilis]|uniref:Uncharacterized protein n=1 Tax=Littorina saxatilis TaxID=31220 RepID=A0AAN9C5B0_9CAEN
MHDSMSSDVSSTSGNDVNTKNLTRLAALKVQQTLLQRALQSDDGKPNSNGKASHLDKPQTDEMMSSSSRETNGTDSGRGCSEDDSQAVESIRSEAESGFASFLAMPLKDGWRHVDTHEYVNSPLMAPPGVKTHNNHTPSIYPSFPKTGCSHPPGKLHDRNCACSMSDLDMERPRTYENTMDASFKSFRTYTPKRPAKTVHFSQDGLDSRQTLPSSASSRSREPRFQPQFQSSRPRSNPAQPANAVCEYVNMGGNGGGRDSGGGSGSLGGSPSSEGGSRVYGDLGFYGGGRRELTGDSLNDSADTADEGNTTTTSGSYTIDQEDNMQDLQSDIFV